MANEQRPIVNQRLYFCRLHLGYLAAELDAQQTAKRVVEQSLGESIVLHLVLAYRAYLQEIAAAYTLPATELMSAEQLISALSENRQQSAEAAELLALEGDGWLAELIARYRRLGGLQRQTASTSGTGSGIAVMQIDNNSPINADLCAYYFQSLSELIENQRTRLEEW